MLSKKLPSVITSKNESASRASMFIIVTGYFFPSETLDKNPTFKTAPTPATGAAIAFP